MENELPKDHEVFSNEQPIQDNMELLETPYLDEREVTPRHLLCLAKWILGFVGVTFVVAGILEVCHPGNAFFEACKVTLPSIATLVIGYYFGTSK